MNAVEENQLAAIENPIDDRMGKALPTLIARFGCDVLGDVEERYWPRMYRT